MSLARDRAPDEELAAIAGAPEPAADVPAWEPDVPLSDAAEQGLSGRPDDPDVLEQDEIVGIFCDHGARLLFRSPRRAHVVRDGGPPQSRCGALNGLVYSSIGVPPTAQCTAASGSWDWPPRVPPGLTGGAPRA